MPGQLVAEDALTTPSCRLCFGMAGNTRVHINMQAGIPVIRRDNDEVRCERNRDEDNGGVCRGLGWGRSTR